jgi:hypothetical protein
MADVDVHYGPVTVVQEPVTVTVEGLDDTTNTVKLETPQPLRSETTSTLVIRDPIRTESTASLDVKPLALDQCLHVRLGPLPPTCIRQPYRLHVGLTFFGVEVFGLSVRGEAETTVTDIPTRPQVVSGDREGAAPAAGGRPLRIRLGP